MIIELFAKDLPAPEMLQERIHGKLEKIESRLGQQLNVRVMLKQEAKNYNCKIHFNASGHEFVGHATSEDLIKAADEAIAKLERQVRRAQTKIEASRHDGLRNGV